MSATKIIHSVPSDPLTGAISVPVYQTSTFIQEAPGVNKGFDYARSNNPTRKALEDVVATLEGGHGAFAFSTGLAAIDAVLKLLKAGDEIIAVDDIYGGAYRLFTHVYEKLGVSIKYVDTTNANNVAKAVSSATKLVWIESPTNPTLKVSDIQAISEITKSVGALLVVDNTFASPIAQQPFSLGADIVVHSGTKYIGGHSDLVAGLVATKTATLSEKIKFIQKKTGKEMQLPLAEEVLEILRKHNGDFPTYMNDQKYNRLIKEVCKLAGFTQQVKGALINKETKRKEEGEYPKWQLVSSHIGRRSFASNNYGILPTPLVMYATGHTTEQMLLKYLQKTDDTFISVLRCLC